MERMSSYLKLFYLTLLIATTFAAGSKLLRKPRKLKEFAAGAPVYGIHVIRDKFYVVHDSTPYIEVYDARGHNSHLYNWSVPGLQGPYDMVGNGKFKVFITDWFDWANISSVSIKVAGTVSKFEIDEPFTVMGLASTEGESSVIATCSATKKLKEFSPSGVLLNSILVPDIEQPRHSIKLKDGSGYAVCHGYGPDQSHRVCRINETGHIQVCHGGPYGSGTNQLNVPARILELPGEGILVADRENKRVVLLDSKTLTFKKEVITASDGLEGPARMVFKDSVLYVADNKVENGLSVSGKVLPFRIMG